MLINFDKFARHSTDEHYMQAIIPNANIFMTELRSWQLGSGENIHF